MDVIVGMNINFFVLHARQNCLPMVLSAQHHLSSDVDDISRPSMTRAINVQVIQQIEGVQLGLTPLHSIDSVKDSVTGNRQTNINA